MVEFKKAPAGGQGGFENAQPGTERASVEQLQAVVDGAFGPMNLLVYAMTVALLVAIYFALRAIFGPGRRDAGGTAGGGDGGGWGDGCGGDGGGGD